MITITSPMDESTARGLKLRETVYLSGTVVTGRDKVHMRALSPGTDAPECLNGATLFHCGPIVVRDGSKMKVIAAGPTTSARMNSMAPEMIRRYGIRAVIGKGGMSDEVLQVMSEVGCVYLAAIGGAAVSLAEG
ncbi:MAG: fumarate hydratase C-terminal domain-containing protein, partial [Methanomassiliicoccaceae archaeon]|nr:fumarate hydratase C-terminal domain-containing protein [Methanomassiliicoccaceae archaeon]